MKSYYYDSIRQEIARQGKIGIDPRHVEGYMRLEHGCLDGLSKQQFNSEVSIAIQCIEQGGVKNAETLAESFAL